MYIIRTCITRMRARARVVSPADVSVDKKKIIKKRNNNNEKTNEKSFTLCYDKRAFISYFSLSPSDPASAYRGIQYVSRARSFAAPLMAREHGVSRERPFLLINGENGRGSDAEKTKRFLFVFFFVRDFCGRPAAAAAVSREKRATKNPPRRPTKIFRDPTRAIYHDPSAGDFFLFAKPDVVTLCLGPMWSIDKPPGSVVLNLWSEAVRESVILCNRGGGGSTTIYLLPVHCWMYGFQTAANTVQYIIRRAVPSKIIFSGARLPQNVNNHWSR